VRKNTLMLSTAARVQRIVRDLIDAGLSRAQIAKTCQATKSAVSLWESGKLHGNPSSATTLGLALLSGKSPWWIAFGHGREEALGIDVAEGTVIIRGDRPMIVYFLSDAEAAHVQVLRRLSEKDRERATTFTETLLQTYIASATSKPAGTRRPVRKTQPRK
jgi:transcriptional regulator with XRE-family HTH domain